MSSTFKVEVVPIELTRHENADSLSVVKVFDWQCIVRTADWEGVKLGCFVPPDSIVPDTEQFAFLDGHRHIKARRLRGVWSMGMLIPAPEGAQIGDDVAEQFGITHYDPPEPEDRNQYPGPSGFKPTYDMENIRRYSDIFIPGEEVYVSEKIHGSSFRATYQDGAFHVGTHKNWIKEGNNIYWRALKQYPILQEYLKTTTKVTVYGEVYGWVQTLRYGHEQGQVSLALFDIWSERGPAVGWYSAKNFLFETSAYMLPVVPLVYQGSFDADLIASHVDGPTFIPGATHHREGIVIKPMEERTDQHIGRVLLKSISNVYLEKSK